MAYSKDQWEKAKEYFEAGLSLSDINLRTEISKPQISKKAKKENWEKGNEKKQLITQAVEVMEKKETLKETALEVHNELVTEGIRRKNLVFGSVEKAVKKMHDIVESGKVEDKINVGDGMQRFEERNLNTTDIKNALDGYDKASITLGVNQRHSNSNINVNTQNNMQQNIELNKEIVSQTLENFENEY